MAHQKQPVRVSIKSTPDLLGVIPTLLGFHPEESLVLLVVADGICQVTARADLVDVASPGAADSLIGRLWFQFPGADAIVVAYTDDAGLAWDALAAVSDALPAGAGLACLQAATDRYHCEQGDDGTPYDTAVARRAASVVPGRTILASRKDITAELKPRHNRTQMRKAARAAAKLNQIALTERASQILASHEFDAEASAIVATACAEPGFCEGIVWAICAANAGDLVTDWKTIASSVEPNLAGPTLGVLAVASWVAGNGALANVCLQRALTLGYWDAWLDLVDLAILGAMHPRTWDDLRAAYLEDVGFGHDPICGVR